MRYGRFLILICIGLLSYAEIFAQQDPGDIDITGLWKGTLYNDSTKQSYKYEIGLSEEKGRITGFSHTWYNEKDYFVVKKLKAKRTKGKIVIEDVDIIAYNYPESPPKGVRRLHILDLKEEDSILTLSGVFSTNRTKTYAPATGTLQLQRKNDFRKQSDLMAHLQELGLEKDLSFVKQEKVEEEELTKLLTKSDGTIASGSLSKPETKKIPVTEKINAPANQPVAIQPLPTTPVNEKPAETTRPSTVTKPGAVAVPAAAEVLTRKNVLQETMYFSTDSLELALYDNGEVDGDTVSVLMNGEILLSKQRLSTNAIRKTIFIPSDADSVQLVMYAENLGTLPPNSGLLVVKDGKEIYEIRFSGDLQKNAAIVFKRKR